MEIWTYKYAKAVTRTTMSVKVLSIEFDENKVVASSSGLQSERPIAAPKTSIPWIHLPAGRANPDIQGVERDVPARVSG